MQETLGFSQRVRLVPCSSIYNCLPRKTNFSKLYFNHDGSSNVETNGFWWLYECVTCIGYYHYFLPISTRISIFIPATRETSSKLKEVERAEVYGTVHVEIFLLYSDIFDFVIL
jgi:hypothetical protein